ncbi:MAG: SIMPL domain-containing protein [bacterium]
MDPKIKNYIGWLSALALLVASFAMFSYVGTYADMARMGAPSFSATGEGKVVAKPDIASFSFQVVDQGGKDIGAVQKTNTDKVNKVLDYLKKEGVKAEDITTSGYNIEPRYQYYGCNNGGVCPPSEIAGYTVNQSVDVKVRDFSKVGQMLGGVVASGANTVSQLSFKVDNETRLRAEARALAIKKAEAQAKETARAAGVKLGRLLFIEESNNPIGPIPYGVGGGADMKLSAEVASVPNIAPGSQEIVVNVVLRYELK